MIRFICIVIFVILFLIVTIPVLIVLAAFALFVGCYSSYKGGLLDEVMRISLCF